MLLAYIQLRINFQAQSHFSFSLLILRSYLGYLRPWPIIMKKIIGLLCYFIVVPLASIAWSFISMNVVGWFAGESYAGATDYMVYLCLGYAFSGMHMMIVNYIYYAKKVKLYTLITILIIICNVVLNGILLYFNGPVGAAQATMCANALSFVLTWMLSARVWKMPWNLMKH